MEKLPTKGELVQLDFVRRERSKRKRCECASPRFLLDEPNDLVECQECGAIVTAMFALKRIARNHDRKNEVMNRMHQQAEQLDNYKPHLKIIKRLEQYWRRKDTLPTCPSCEEPFYLEELTKWIGRTWGERQVKARQDRKTQEGE